MPCFAWGSFWWVFPLAMLAMLAIGFLIFRRACGTGARGGAPLGGCCAGWPRGSPDALETLKHRYAKGELTKEAFDAMRQDLVE